MVIEPRTGALCTSCGVESPQVLVRPLIAARLERILRVTQTFFGIRRRGKAARAYTGPPARRWRSVAAVIAGVGALAHGRLHVS